MKRKYFFHVFLFFILLYASSFSVADEAKRLNLILKDGKVSADIQNAPLREVAHQVGQKLGISVDFHGTLQKDQQAQLVSTKFEDLPIVDSLYRLFRTINFTYIEGERLSLLGFGQSALKNESTQVTSISSSLQSLSRTFSSPEIKKEETEKPATISTPSRTVTVEERKSQQAIPLGTGNLPLNEGEALKLNQGEVPQSPETKNPGDIIISKDSKQIGSSFQVPISLDSGGQGISALSSDFIYDPNYLANPRVTIGNSGSQAGKDVVFNEVRPGLFRVGVIGLNQNSIPDGEVAYVTFDVLTGGQTSLRSLPTASDSHGNMIPVTFNNGRITTRR